MEKKNSSRPSSKTKPSSGKKPDSGKGGHKKKKKKGKEVEPFTSKHPAIDYTLLMNVPQIQLSIKLLNSKLEQFEISVPITHSLNKICEIINKKHSSACKNIRLYMDVDVDDEESKGGRKEKKIER